MKKNFFLSTFLLFFALISIFRTHIYIIYILFEMFPFQKFSFFSIFFLELFYLKFLFCRRLGSEIFIFFSFDHHSFIHHPINKWGEGLASIHKQKLLFSSKWWHSFSLFIVVDQQFWDYSVFFLLLFVYLSKDFE